jgi:hypothetical protein
MGAELKLFDLSNVTILLADVPILKGHGDDDKGVIKIKPRGASFGDEVGSLGEVLRYRTGETRWDIELMLLGCAEANAALSALHSLDCNEAGGAGVGALFVKDNNGSDIYAAGQCWISEAPENALGRSKAPKVWKFVAVADPSTMIAGGN